MNKKIVKIAFADTNNYMKNGVLLRQVINVINEIDFNEHSDEHAFGFIYEKLLHSLQSAGNAGEFYTPRGLTDFIAEVVKPKLGEKIADFACGTGGFLASSLNYLEKQIKTSEDRKKYGESVYGIEKKPFPFLLCVTNMLLHKLDNPEIYKENSLSRNVRDFEEKDKFDVILMNPPYGGSELEQIKRNFPVDLRSSDTTDLFMSVIMYRLKKGGRCAVVLPNTFLEGEDNAKKAIKKKLLTEFNLHTIIRLPNSVFAPYTPIATNVMFFDNTGKTKETWFYRFDMPEGYKSFSKTKPIKLEHLTEVKNWMNNKKVIVEGEEFKANKYSFSDIENNNFKLNFCNYPVKKIEYLSPFEMIDEFQNKSKTYIDNISSSMQEILKIIKGE